MLPNSPFTAQAAVVRLSKNAPAMVGMMYAFNIVDLLWGEDLLMRILAPSVHKRM
jgi:hypothetical protein